MKKYEIVVSGTVVRECETKKEAEELLAEIKKSPLGWVHPKDCMWVREQKDK